MRRFNFKSSFGLSLDQSHTLTFFVIAATPPVTQLAHRRTRPIIGSIASPCCFHIRENTMPAFVLLTIEWAYASVRTKDDSSITQCPGSFGVCKDERRMRAGGMAVLILGIRLLGPITTSTIRIPSVHFTVPFLRQFFLINTRTMKPLLFAVCVLAHHHLPK